MHFFDETIKPDSLAKRMKSSGRISRFTLISRTHHIETDSTVQRPGPSCLDNRLNCVVEVLGARNWRLLLSQLRVFTISSRVALESA
jgi:hypothetical protein